MIKLCVLLCFWVVELFSFQKDTFFVETLDGEVINLTLGNKDIVLICFNNYSCSDCFPKLLSELTKKYPKSKFAFLIRTQENSSRLKRVAISKIKTILSNPKREFDFYFDIHKEIDSWPPYNLKEGIFSKFNIDKTPAYFVITRDSITFVPFKKIQW